jgi:hypothetical protein
MQETRPRIEETLEWIRAGDQDFLSAVVLLKRTEPLIAHGLFHCQQAVEKWLKAILIWHGVGFLKIHDLGRMAPFAWLAFWCKVQRAHGIAVGLATTSPAASSRSAYAEIGCQRPPELH